MKEITGYLIDIENGKCGVVTVDGSLDGFYEILNCDCFDITHRLIGGKPFDIFVDDEGLLKENPLVSAYDVNGDHCLVGNLFVVKVDDEGETISLTEEEINHVAQYVKTLISFKRGRLEAVLTEVDYE